MVDVHGRAALRDRVDDRAEAQGRGRNSEITHELGDLGSAQSRLGEHGVVGEDLLARAVGDNRSVRHRDDAIKRVGHETHVVRDRDDADALVVGGVRFKYQPGNSGRSLEEDLRLGMQRCDAIVVTGEGSAITTPHDKTREFRAVVGEDYPLVIGAGVTPASAAADLADADALIVGSALKDTYLDTGDVDEAHTRELVAAIRALTPRQGAHAMGGIR